MARAHTLGEYEGLANHHAEEAGPAEGVALLGSRPSSLQKRSVEELLLGNHDKRGAFSSTPPKKLLKGGAKAGPLLFHANAVVHAAGPGQAERAEPEEPQRPLQLSARELPDLEELFEEAPGSRAAGQSLDEPGHSPNSDSSGFRPASPSRLLLGEWAGAPGPAQASARRAASSAPRWRVAPRSRPPPPSTCSTTASRCTAWSATSSPGGPAGWPTPPPEHLGPTSSAPSLYG